MGRKNDVVLEYLKDTARFADLYNGGCFDGEQIVLAEDLMEGAEVYHQETERKAESGHQVDEKRKKTVTTTRTRDVKKRLKSGENLRILAVESQLLEDYTMPWRHMNYDALEYGTQIKEIKSRNEQEKKLNTDEAFLCGLTKEDLLTPVYTVCLYLGEKPWQGPRSLKEMMNFGESNEPWQKWFADYQMNLICVNELTDFSKFRTSLRQLFLVLANREDREKLEEVIESDPAFEALDEETARVAGVLIGAEEFMEERIKEEGDKVNMCTALKQLRAEGIAEGHAIGHAEGHAEGIALMNALNMKLIQDDRIDDLLRASSDAEFQKQLLEEYGLYSESFNGNY